MWYGNYRNRMVVDNSRNRSNGYYRQPGRMGNVRAIFDPKRGTEKLSVSAGVSTTDKSFSGGSDHSNQEDVLSIHEHVPGEAQECNEAGVTALTSENESSKAVVQTFDNRKVYRDRISTSVQSINQSASISSNYDAGPIGRARRSYQRLQPSYASDVDYVVGNHSTLMTNPSIPALLPFHQGNLYF